MRIALVNYAAGGHHVGYARDIVGALRRGAHQVFSVGPREWAHAFASDATPILVEMPRIDDSWRRRNAQFRQFLAACLKACATAEVDVIHLMYIDGFTEAIARVGLPSDIAIVGTLHWYPFLGASLSMGRQWIKAWHTQACLAWLGRCGMELTVHSDVAAQQLRHLGIKVTAFHYPNSGGLQRAEPTVRQAVRRDLALTHDDRLLLCFGGTRFDKGVDLAIEALAQAPARDRLLVAGEPQHFDVSALHALARQHRVADRVIWKLQRIDEGDVAGLFAASDVVLLPYRPVFKGQSGPLVTAAAVGRPVIAADVPVLAETVRRFQLGSLFHAGDIADLVRALQSGQSGFSEQSAATLATAADPLNFARGMVDLYDKAHQRMKATVS